MRRTGLENWICEIESLPELTREGLDALQLDRLNRLLARERERGGFYKDLPARLDNLWELCTLPFTTAEDLAANAGGMLLTSQSEISRVISGETSGTTGPAKRIFYTERDLEQTVGFFAAGISEFVAEGDVVMIAMPFSGPFGLGDLIARAVERLGARPIRSGIGRNYGELSRIIKTERPAAYIGMAVPLLGMLRFCGKGSLHYALVSGDACPAGIVDEIEALLGTRLFPHYGSRECGLGGAVTCPAHMGMHVRENHIIAEIIGPGGAPAPDGELGELVITTIGQEALPLIRYRTGDTARIIPGSCPCGGVTRRIDQVSRADALMPRLDEALFRAPKLVDFRIRLGGAAAAIEALTMDGRGDGLETLARGALPGCDVTVSARKADEGDAPMYPAKRHIIF